MGLRDNRGGLAPLGAVLSFLRLEGQAVYDDVMTRAGRSSAEWHLVEDPVAMRMAKALPRGWRRRYALGSHTASGAGGRSIPAHAQVSARRGHARVDIDGSVFCAFREPWPWPTCTYFSAGYSALCRAVRRSGAGGDRRVPGDRSGGVPARRRVHGGACRGSLGMIGARCASAATVAAALLLLAGIASPSAQPPRAVTLVVPFALEKFEARVAWLGEGTAIGVTAALAERGVEVVGRDERLEVFD